MLKNNHMNTVGYANRTPLLRRLSLVAMSMALVFACGMGQRASAPPPDLSVDVLVAGTQGSGSRQDPSAEWVTSQEELEQLLDTQSARQLPAQDGKSAHAADVTTSRILLVRMGQKPTAGYSFTLEPESCSISQQTAHITLIWTEPAPGMVTAQVITHPFILLKISKGGFDSIKIVDQHGQIRLEMPVDE